MLDLTTQDALVLSARRLGERAHIISLLTAEHGRLRGVLRRGGAPATGSWVHARWQARLSEHLGTYALEETHSGAVRFLDDRKRLACLVSLCALLDDTLPERQRYDELYQAARLFLNTLETPDFLMRYVRLEMTLLKTLGFGLDTSCCAGGGDDDDLAYISPKTGRAVCHVKGAPYRDKLYALPRFLWQDAPATPADIRAGLHLTGAFLLAHAARSLPQARARLIPAEDADER